jgi:hypothetical protein
MDSPRPKVIIARIIGKNRSEKRVVSILSRLSNRIAKIGIITWITDVL